MSESYQLELTGLDGSNPLAFLAALGTLRTLTIASPDASLEMKWSSESGIWKPSLRSVTDVLEPSQVCSKLISYLASPRQLQLLEEIGDNLTLSPNSFRELAKKTLDSSKLEDRIDADFMAAFGSDGTYQPHSNDRTLIQDTALRTMSGAGHQHFIRFMRDIIHQTTSSHIHEALFAPWRYQDQGRGLNLRWDPIDDRRYAMRWKNPSSDPNMTMRGANRLAIEAIPWFPTAVKGTSLETTGFTTLKGKGTFLHWPIWDRWAPATSITSLLQRHDVVDNQEPSELPRGVATVFRSQRITNGQFRNFTPAVAIA